MKQKELTLSRGQISETQNEKKWVELSSCALPNFEKCAGKTFCHGDQTVSCWRIFRGSDQYPESTSCSGVNSDLRELFLWRSVRIDVHAQRPFTFGSHPLFLEMHANSGSKRQAQARTCLKAASVRPEAQRASALSWQPGGAAHTLRAPCWLFLLRVCIAYWGLYKESEAYCQWNTLRAQ